MGLIGVGAFGFDDDHGFSHGSQMTAPAWKPIDTAPSDEWVMVKDANGTCRGWQDPSHPKACSPVPLAPPQLRQARRQDLRHPPRQRFHRHSMPRKGIRPHRERAGSRLLRRDASEAQAGDGANLTLLIIFPLSGSPSRRPRARRRPRPLPQGTPGIAPIPLAFRAGPGAYSSSSKWIEHWNVAAASSPAALIARN